MGRLLLLLVLALGGRRLRALHRRLSLRFRLIEMLSRKDTVIVNADLDLGGPLFVDRTLFVGKRTRIYGGNTRDRYRGLLVRSLRAHAAILADNYSTTFFEGVRYAADYVESDPSTTKLYGGLHGAAADRPF